MRAQLVLIGILLILTANLSSCLKRPYHFNDKRGVYKDIARTPEQREELAARKKHKKRHRKAEKEESAVADKKADKKQEQAPATDNGASIPGGAVNSEHIADTSHPGSVPVDGSGAKPVEQTKPEATGVPPVTQQPDVAVPPPAEQKPATETKAKKKKRSKKSKGSVDGKETEQNGLPESSDKKDQPGSDQN